MKMNECINIKVVMCGSGANFHSGKYKRPAGVVAKAFMGVWLSVVVNHNSNSGFNKSTWFTKFSIFLQIAVVVNRLCNGVACSYVNYGFECKFHEN